MAVDNYAAPDDGLKPLSHADLVNCPPKAGIVNCQLARLRNTWQLCLMVTITSFRKLALRFNSAVELPHFENVSFRVKKKIFATLNTNESRGCLKFSEDEQALFCSHDKEIIYPVPNKWGKQGWTLVNLKKISPALLKAAMTAAYLNVAAGKPKPKTSKKSVKSL